jgi:hypothetical protein
MDCHDAFYLPNLANEKGMLPMPNMWHQEMPMPWLVKKFVPYFLVLPKRH